MAAYNAPLVGAIVSDSGSGTLTPPLPASWAPGMLLKLTAASRGAGQTLATPAGWTPVASLTTLGSTFVYLKIAEAGETSPTLDFSSNSYQQAQITAFGGDVYTDITSIIHQALTGSSTSSGASLTDITPTLDECLLIWIFRKSKTSTSDGIAFTPPAGVTEIAESSPNGTAQSLWIGYEQQTTKTARTGLSLTQVGTTESQNRQCIVIAVKTQAPAASDPVIDTVTSPMTDGQAFTITGSFSASGNTLLINGVSHTIGTQNATTITGTLAHGDRFYGASSIVVVNSAGRVSNEVLVQVNTAATEKYVDIGPTDQLYPSENRVNASPDLVEGIQLRYRNVTNAALATTVITERGDIIVDPTVEATPVTLDVAGFDGTTWSAFTTLTVQRGGVAPVFTPTIGNVSLNVGDAPAVVVGSSFFTGGAIYSIAPAVPAHWSFDAGSGRLVVPATVAGNFGSFTITATNAQGGTASNAFTVTVTAGSVRPRPRRGRRDSG